MAELAENEQNTTPETTGGGNTRRIAPGSVWRRVGGNEWVEHVVTRTFRGPLGEVRVAYIALMHGLRQEHVYNSSEEAFRRGFTFVHGPTSLEDQSSASS